LFTIFPLIACLALMFLPRLHKKRKNWWMMGVIMSGVYLAYSLFNKANINNDALTAFRDQGITYHRYFTTPAPMQNILWMVAAGNDSGYHVGFRSLLDSGPAIRFRFFPSNKNYLDTLLHHEDVGQLIRFSQGFYTVEKWGDTLVFNDLRFGQIIGWQDPKEKFVFHYFLQHPQNNHLVVQRGRFAKWDRNVFRLYLERIWGN
jgi:inner membrane protein